MWRADWDCEVRRWSDFIFALFPAFVLVLALVFVPVLVRFPCSRPNPFDKD